MKKLLLGCLGLIGLLIVVAIAGMNMMDPEYEIVRTQTVSGTPAEAYAVVSDLHTWPEWTFWSRDADPNCVWDWTGPEKGTGSTMSWKGDTHGQGRLTLGECVEDKQVAYDMFFMEVEEESTAKGVITFNAVGEGTEVVWTMTGEVSGVFKLMKPLMDGIMGPMFEVGLSGLDEHLSAPK